MPPCVIEGKAYDLLAFCPGDELYRLRSLAGYHIMLDPRVEVFSVLSHYDQIHIFIARAHSRDGFGRAEIGI